MTGAELARVLGLTRGRISQLTTDGTLTGCYSGEGRLRRYDLTKVAEVLNRQLDPGQMLGNGRKTSMRIEAILNGESMANGHDQPEAAPPLKPDTELPHSDAGRYELARTMKAEEDARRARLSNAQLEGTVVLASSVDQVTRRRLGQEIAEFETVLREGARRIADEMGVDFRAARQILTEAWRAHRGTRTEALREDADAAQPSAEEDSADI